MTYYKKRLKYINKYVKPEIMEVSVIKSKDKTSCFVTYNYGDRITEKCFHSEETIPKRVKEFMSKASTVNKVRQYHGELVTKYLI